MAGQLLILCCALLSSAAWATQDTGEPLLLGTDFNRHVSFSYPQLVISATNEPVVASHASYQQSAIVVFNTTGKSPSSMDKIASSNTTFPPNSSLPFDMITDFSPTPHGCVFTGSVGRVTGCSTRFENDTHLTLITKGYIRPVDIPRVYQAPDREDGVSVQGMYAVDAPTISPDVACVIADTNTIIPGTQTTYDEISLPSTDVDGHRAFHGCSGDGHHGIYYKSNGTLFTVADGSTAAPGSSDRFHGFLSTSVHGNRVAFFGNVPSHLAPPRLFLGGVYVAEMYHESHFNVTTVAAANQNLTGWTAFGSPVIEGDQVAFVAMLADGSEGVYLSQRTDAGEWSHPKCVAKTGQVPSGGSEPFAQFPEPPSLCNGELVFRVYMNDGSTAIYFSDRSGNLNKLIDTNHILKGNRSIVYLGAASGAYGGCYNKDRVITFYASSTDANGKEAYDGIYLLDVGMHPAPH